MMTNFPPDTLIDPQARVINIDSSTRAIGLIHRCLLSHLVLLGKKKKTFIQRTIGSELFETEYNSTAQLADDLGEYLKGRQNG